MAARGKANYGIDALDITRTFALAGAGFTASSRLIIALGMRGRMLRVTGATLAGAGAVYLGLAASMLAYGLRGNRIFCRRMLDMIDWRGDERVLDIGTGRGMMMIAAAKRLTTGSAVGIDLQSAHSAPADDVKLALRNAEIEGVRSKVQVHTQDAGRLDFTNNAFDVIVSTLHLHTIQGRDDRTAACREIARVLKPGGTVLIADYVATAQYARLLAYAGLIVERSRPYVLESFTNLRVVAATKPL